MSVRLLRTAAKVLRDTAASCEQGDWVAETLGEGQAWINLPAYHHAFGMHGFHEEALYVALVAPPVALALADLLDAHAESVEEEGPLFSMTSDVAAALSVARAILREGQ